MKLSVVMFCVFPLLTGACGGVPSDPLLRFAGVKECNPNEVFKPFGGIPLKLPLPVEKEIFVKGERSGCIGIFWQGQTGDPPVFTMLVKSDGSYLVYDSVTKQPATQDNRLGATISPGVSEVDVAICVTKTPTERILELDCKNLVKQDVKGCMANADVLFGWKGSKIPVNPGQGNGTCSLCHHERCDNKDNNCDGQIDNDGACGKMLGIDCKAHDKAVIDATAPKCSSQEACQCLRLNTGDYYVCAGKTAPEVKWTKVTEAAGACSAQQTGGTYFCGSKSLVCDRCDGNNYAWRNKEGSCTDGIIKQP